MARSRSKGGESQALVVSLVLFVLLSIILGITTFLGYSGQDELFKRAEAKEKEADIATKNILREKALKLMWKSGVNALQGDEKQEYTNVKDTYGPKDLDPEGKAAKGLEYDTTAHAFKKSAIEENEALKNALKTSQNAEATAKQNLEDTKKKFEKDILDKDAEVKKTKEELAKTKDEIKAKIAEIDKNYQAKIKEFEDAIAKNEVDQNKLNKLTNEKDNLVAQLQQAQSALEKVNNKKKELEQKIFSENQLNYQTAKGKVVRVDTDGTSVFVNLGQADLAKPGLTFSVFSPGAYKADAAVKAKLEVTQVLNDHLSRARVTETKNAVRDPIVSGDELFNPVWTPGLKEHIAITGIIDLSGTGKNDTAEFVRNLEAMGVAVDMWMDAKEGKLKGPGITAKTTYLVEAGFPDFDPDAALRPDNKKQEDKEKIHTQGAEIKKQAIDQGATVIPIRQFIALVGYKTPRNYAPASDSSQKMAPPPAVAPAEKPKDPAAK
jgi:chemotaxis protein histidine kinase CheA